MADGLHKKEMNDRDKVDGSDLDSGGSTKASGSDMLSVTSLQKN